MRVSRREPSHMPEKRVPPLTTGGSAVGSQCIQLGFGILDSAFRNAHNEQGWAGRQFPKGNSRASQR